VKREDEGEYDERKEIKLDREQGGPSSSKGKSRNMKDHEPRTRLRHK